jgi:DNA-binding MarR family transcriptional regulator
MGAVLDAALLPAGVMATEYALLSLLDVAGPMPPTRVARTVGVAPSTLASQVKTLVRTGLICRRQNPADRRSALLELTPHGRERYAAAMPLAATASRSLHRALAGEGTGAEEVRARLRALSAALQSVLDQKEPEITGS